MAIVTLGALTLRLTHHALFKRHRYEVFADDGSGCFLYAGGVTAYKTKQCVVIHDLFILEPYRRQGIARLLLGTASGKGRSSLHVYEYNTEARQLYESLGYVVVGSKGEPRMLRMVREKTILVETKDDEQIHAQTSCAD
ncbi:acetyltransferase [Pseudomonas phage Lu11]|uniref:acetyltransferase n=1 Tax=Pseudomonas phage Lu11 TaxID=1161927 RepID=UPI00025F18D1|nr:acetyltransferase [Pseudomonas phage Lu11]AFH14903.1 hypothetical protein Lu11_0365 [Pseudomonas phage Lu11]